MSFSLRIRGFEANIDIRATLRGNEEYTRVFTRMRNDLDIPPDRARRILEDMIHWSVARYATDIVDKRSALIDEIVAIRSKLEDLNDTLLNYDAATGGTRIGSTAKSLDQQIATLSDLYRQLDDKMRQASAPLIVLTPDAGKRPNLPKRYTDEIRDANAASVSTSNQTLRTHTDDLAWRKHSSRDRAPIYRRVVDPVTGASKRTVVYVTTNARRRLEAGRYAFKRSGDGSYLRRFKDGATAALTLDNGLFRIVTRDANGIKTGDFTEFDILRTPYGRKPRTTGILQAHHGFQDSLMKDLFGPLGYNGNSAPTIWLRNSRSGSPHGRITDAQNTRGRARTTTTAAPTTSLTFADIRRMGINDLKMANMPEAKIVEYMAEFDRYFEQAVLPKIRAEGKTHLLGDWQPAGGSLAP